MKYLLASAGLGFLWVRAGVIDRLLPTQTGWFADEDIFRMDISDYSPHESARRFDAGTPPVPNIYAGVAGLELLQETGVPAVEAHVASLNTRLIEGLEELGATVVTPSDPQGAAPSSASPRPTRPPSSPPSPRSGSRARSATRTSASPRTSTTPTPTSTRCSTPSPAAAARLA